MFCCPCPPPQKRANNLQDIIEQLSANKADRRELLELKQFMVSLNVSLRVSVTIPEVERSVAEIYPDVSKARRLDCTTTQSRMHNDIEVCAMFSTDFFRDEAYTYYVVLCRMTVTIDAAQREHQ